VAGRCPVSPVEDLREAARQLRERVAAVPDDAKAPWRPVITDSESASGVGVCGQPDHDGPWACDDCWPIETYSEGLAAYLASMHPRVGRALAAWWDCVAIDEEQGEPESAPRIRERTAALLLARTYLGRSTEDGAR
jgi:hypothetical protein